MKKLILLALVFVFISCQSDENNMECGLLNTGENCTECIDGYVKENDTCIYDCSNIDHINRVNDENNSCICEDGYDFNKSTKVCEKQVECLNDTECEAKEICESDTCIAGCRADESCDSGSICENNACIVGCRADENCDNGSICENNACIVGCREDNDCEGTKVCTDNLCELSSNVLAPTAKCNVKINGNSIGGNVEVEPAIDGGVNPPSIISLDGSESFDPNGEVLTYKWEKVDSPLGSVAIPRTPNAAESTYFVDLSGEHKLRLTVTNESGLSSICEVIANGVTSNALHIELFWDKPGDIDLHLRQPGAGDTDWGHATKDCFWKTCQNGLEWGSPGDINNPKIKRDDMTEQGPENINIDTPQVTTAGNYYTVGVKNYSHGDSPNATVRIYCNGSPQFEHSMNLPDAAKSFWKVADIEWTEVGCNITPINVVIDYPGAAGTK